MTLYPILQAAAGPFYTNDFAGVVKLLGTVIVTASVVGGIVIRLVFNATRQKQADMQRDIDGLGKRLNAEETARATCTGAVSALTERMTRHEGNVAQVMTGHAELKATVEAMRSQSAEQQRDIMAAIMQTGQQFNSAFTDLKVDVAKLTVMGEVGRTLAEGFSEIASIMRENRQQGGRGRNDG